MPQYEFSVLNQKYVKHCTNCTKEYYVHKPEDFQNYFNKNKQTRDGLSSWCKDCHYSAHRQSIGAE